MTVVVALFEPIVEGNSIVHTVAHPQQLLIQIHKRSWFSSSL